MKKRILYSVLLLSILNSSAMAYDSFFEGLESENPTEPFMENTKVNEIKPQFDIKIGYSTINADDTKMIDTHSIGFEVNYKIADDGILKASNVSYFGILGHISSGSQKSTNKKYSDKLGDIFLTNGWYYDTCKTDVSVFAGYSAIKQYIDGQIEIETPHYGIGLKNSFKLAKSDLWAGFGLSYSYGNSSTYTVDNIKQKKNTFVNDYKIDFPLELRTSKNYSLFIKYEYEVANTTHFSMHTHRTTVGVHAVF